MSGIFPLSLPGLSIKVSRETEYPVNIHTSYSGKELRSAWRSAPIYNFEVTFNFLRQAGYQSTYDELAVLSDFYNNNEGSHKNFVILDPIDSVYRLVRFEDDELEFGKIVHNIWKTGTIKLKGVTLPASPTPVLTISAPVDFSIQGNTPITYTANATSTGYTDHTYSWSFDDGTTGSGASLSKTWSGYGLKVATCTATCTETAKYASDTVTILVPDPNLVLDYRPSGHGQVASGNKIYLLGGDSDLSLGVIDFTDYTTSHASKKGAMTDFHYDRNWTFDYYPWLDSFAVTADGLYAVWAGNYGAPTPYADNRIMILDCTTGVATIMTLPTSSPFNSAAKWGTYYNTEHHIIRFTPTSDNLILCSLWASDGAQYNFKINPSTAAVSGTVYTTGYPTEGIRDGNDIYVLTPLGFNSYNVKKYTFGSGLVSTSGTITLSTANYGLNVSENGIGNWIKAPNGKLYSSIIYNGYLNTTPRVVWFDPTDNTVGHIELTNYPDFLYGRIFGAGFSLFDTDKILISGGYGCVTDLWTGQKTEKAGVIDTSDDSYTATANDLPSARFFHGQCECAGMVVLTGGIEASGTSHYSNLDRSTKRNSVWIYNPATNSFSGATGT